MPSEICAQTETKVPATACYEVADWSGKGFELIPGFVDIFKLLL